jgi:hypothetical protein
MSRASSAESSVPQSDLGKFCSKMDEFFAVLTKAYPDDKELPYYEDKLKAARKINPRMICERFMQIIMIPVPPGHSDSGSSGSGSTVGSGSIVGSTVGSTVGSGSSSNGGGQLFLHKIMQNDDGFFMEFDPGQQLEENYQKLIIKVRSLWATMSDSSKEAIRKYMQILVTRGAIATRDQVALAIINQYRIQAGLPMV